MMTSCKSRQEDKDVNNCYTGPQNQRVHIVLKVPNVQKVMSQRSMGSCTRCTRANASVYVNDFLHIYVRHFSSKLGKLLNSTHLNCRRRKWTTPQRDECRTVHALMMMVCSSVNSMNANT